MLHLREQVAHLLGVEATTAAAGGGRDLGYDERRLGHHRLDPGEHGVAGKAVKEVAYHLDHARQWVLRLGDGTEESHRRMQAALDAEWRYLDELFDGSWVAPELIDEGIAVDPASLREPALARVLPVLREATLHVPEVLPAVGGGRRGLHTEQLGYLLAEMQHLTRSHPGATW